MGEKWVKGLGGGGVGSGEWGGNAWGRRSGGGSRPTRKMTQVGTAMNNKGRRVDGSPRDGVCVCGGYQQESEGITFPQSNLEKTISARTTHQPGRKVEEEAPP